MLRQKPIPFKDLTAFRRTAQVPLSAYPDKHLATIRGGTERFLHRNANEAIDLIPSP
jgi:hypothetical protein